LASPSFAACLGPTAAQQPLSPSLLSPAADRWGPDVRVAPHLQPTPFPLPCSQPQRATGHCPRLPRLPLLQARYQGTIKPPGHRLLPLFLPFPLIKSPPLDGIEARRPPWPLMANTSNRDPLSSLLAL
jgi:hypothetical protein